MTNYERIKAMTIDEMIHCNDICPMFSEGTTSYCQTSGSCNDCRKEWLESEVKTNETNTNNNSNSDSDITPQGE